MRNLAQRHQSRRRCSVSRQTLRRYLCRNEFPQKSGVHMEAGPRQDKAPVGHHPDRRRARCHKEPYRRWSALPASRAYIAPSSSCPPSPLDLRAPSHAILKKTTGSQPGTATRRKHNAKQKRTHCHKRSVVSGTLLRDADAPARLRSKQRQPR